MTGMLLCWSVITKFTVNPSVWRFTLPSSTRPPMRKLRPCGASLLNTWVGVKYRLTFLSNAFNTRPTTRASAPTATTINTSLFWRGFMLFLISGFIFSIAHQAHLLQGNFSLMDHHRDLDRKNEQRDGIRAQPDIRKRIFPHPDIQSAHDRTSGNSAIHLVCRSRSRMMLRTRASTTAIAYSQQAASIVNMACCIATCIEVRSEEHTSELQSPKDLVCRL